MTDQVVPPNSIDVILKEMIVQMKEWKDVLCRLSMKPELYLLFSQTYMALVSASDYKYHNKEKERGFEAFYLNQTLKDLDIAGCMKIVKRRIPDQEKKIQRVVYLFNLLKPIWSYKIDM